jgi:hypothetical protein
LADTTPAAAVHDPPSLRTQVQVVGVATGDVLPHFTLTLAEPVPLAFAIQTEPTRFVVLVKDASAMVVVAIVPVLPVLVTSAHVPPIGAPATVATVEALSVHPAVALVPVL